MNKVLPGEKQFTASVWVLTKTKPKKVLLVHHKKYDKWIQPGGHIEHFENPIECAVREIKEETGLDISFINSYMEQTVDGVTSFLKTPDFFLEQRIPAHGEQPEHFHLDHQYIVKVDEQMLKHNISESHGIGWFSKKEALALPIHEDTKIILQKLL
ncbi:MAG TPA: NUDIX domain-containing protein [Xanthomonadales bacterium]|nr:NUDIX domain-containing protein [Xanthomonadales bacterium]